MKPSWSSRHKLSKLLFWEIPSVAYDFWCWVVVAAADADGSACCWCCCCGDDNDDDAILAYVISSMVPFHEWVAAEKLSGALWSTQNRGFAYKREKKLAWSWFINT